MSFITSICLSSTALSGDTINIYSNADQFGTAFTSTTLSQISTPNCPVALEVPDGTTQLLFVDTVTLCSTLVDISADLCVTCNLGLSEVSTGVGSLSVGELTGTCVSAITDYQIYWYGPDNQSQLAFISGEGTQFPYNQQHPILNRPVLSGTYYPVIEKVKINNNIFSLSGENNTIISNLDCLSPITITEDFSCENGDTAQTYSHSLSFTTQANGLPPEGVSGKFIFLSSNTEAFAFSFYGYTVPDRLKIYFSGSFYSDLIVLEDVIVGSDLNPLSFVPLDVIPKEISTYFWAPFKKVIPLTGLTLNSGDFLIIEVIPNQNNPQTNWTLEFTCTEIDCPACTDQYINSPYKIVTNSVEIQTGTCGTREIMYQLSGCTGSEIDNSWINKYLMYLPTSYMRGFDNNGLYEFNTNTLYYNKVSCFDNSLYYNEPSCFTSGGYLKYQRNSITEYFFEFSNFNDFKRYFDSFTYTKNNFSGSINSNDNSYYTSAQFFLYYGNTTGTTCGDVTNFTTIVLHPQTMIISSGSSGLNYTLTINQPPVSGKTFTECELFCNYLVTGFLANINSIDYNAPSAFTSNVGLQNLNPLRNVGRLVSWNDSRPSFRVWDSQHLWDYSNKFIPYSGNNQIITSLSGTVCSNLDYSYFSNPHVYLTGFRVNAFLLETNNSMDFQLYSSPVNNWFLGPEELAYEFSGGQVTFSSSTYCI